MIKEILGYKLLEMGSYSITVQNIVSIVFIIILTKFILNLIGKALSNVKKRREERQEDFYMINKIVNYIVWIIAIIFILNSVGIKITVLLTGSAALLVGVGLGLQQTFNDFISGIILLFEGKTKVGDLLEVEGRMMTLKNIGLRTTEGVDRDGVTIIIPNSRIVTDKVVNYTHQEGKKIRFKIKVGIAYGSDVELAIRLLESCAVEHPGVIDKHAVEARFIDFADSSLNFELLFLSKRIFRIGKIESDIRRCINKKFIENNINIPFPQMDIHTK
ncbi:MAG TPA: mechanosensitive ion channel [Phaeodactylibacter sp.]|nr:mechanosensitive ion channel [Phaeodactylibacter sp.]